MKTAENLVARESPRAAPTAPHIANPSLSKASTERWSVARKPSANATSVCSTPAWATRFGSNPTSAAAASPIGGPV